MHLLVIEDDPRLVRLLRRLLEEDRHVVETATTGLDGLDIAEATGGIEVVILDIGLPDISGLEVARRIRATGSEVSILMLTARDTVGDRVTGLDAGADDYLVKPFSLQVLEAHLRAVLRRRQPTPEILVAGDLELDTATRRARRAGREIELTATEFRLLAQLMRESGKPIPKHELTQRVWGYDFEGNDNVLEVYIGYLRNKLEAEGEPRLIQTLRGIGYALRVPAMA